MKASKVHISMVLGGTCLALCIVALLLKNSSRAPEPAVGSNHDAYLSMAVEQGLYGMRHNHGGPFGAVVVSEGKIIGVGYNMVTSTNDPTAHAEVTAIRNACKAQKSFHLKKAVLYTSCEPCPMCLGAAYWANIEEIIYSSDRYDAANIGFSDQFIYDEIAVDLKDRKVKTTRIVIPSAGELFREWAKKQNKVPY